jgi:hypothetical protein
MMEDNPIFISFLLPTRDRYSELRNSINSIRANCSRNINFEILIAIDSDDDYMISKISEIYNSHRTNFCDIKVLIMKRQYYQNLQNYYNALCALSKGKLLWLWNDDAKIISQNWDTIIQEEYNDENFIVFMCPEIKDEKEITLWGGFPIFTRKLYELLGHVSQSPHNDGYLQKVGNGSDIVKLSKVTLLHKQLSSPESMEAVRQHQTVEKLNSNEMSDRINEDIILIKNKIKEGKA